MVTIKLITNRGKSTDIVPESMTVRQVYEKNGVNFESCTNTIDSVPLQLGDLDKTLAQLGLGSEARFSSIVKMDNAAKIIIVGNAAVVRSGVKYEDWKRALKYDPDLGLYDEDNNKLFAVYAQDGMAGELDANGVAFGLADADGYAEITLCMCGNPEDKKAYVAEKCGAGLHALNQLEAKMPEILDEAAKYEQEILSSITTM